MIDNCSIRVCLLLAVAVSAGSACRTVNAETPIERPALEVPPPPPRVIAPLPSPDEPPVLEPVSQLPSNPADRNINKPRPSRPKPDPQAPQDPKPAEQVEAPAPVQLPPAPQQPSSPLRIENPNSAQLTAQIRDTIGRSRGLVGQVARNRLPTESLRKAYDDAQLFAQQAEEALSKNNLVAAKELAEKAERLAKELQGR